ncbi:WD40 repeat-like protein [Penicillium brevicompactum]
MGVRRGFENYIKAVYQQARKIHIPVAIITRGKTDDGGQTGQKVFTEQSSQALENIIHEYVAPGGVHGLPLMHRSQEDAPPKEVATVKPPAQKKAVPKLVSVVSSITEKERKAKLAPNPTPDATTTSPEQSFLWEEAYDLLKRENPVLVTEYEILLSQVDVETKPTLLTSKDATIIAENKIPQNDSVARRQTLQNIALHSLEEMQDGRLKTTFFGKQVVWQEAIGKFGLGVSWVQEYTRDAFRDVPYAPIVMAGIGLLLPLLTGPFTADSENHQGILYVTSQIRYYIKMETLMLPSCLDAGIKTELKERVKCFYKLVIGFQVQSVMRWDRSPLQDYLKSVVDSDDWGTQLSMIKEAEQTLRDSFQDAASWTSVQKLDTIKQEAQESRKALDAIADQTREISQHMSNAEHRRCREILKATNPQHDKERIEEFKGGLLKDSYHWIVQHEDFKQWMAAKSGQLLWIKGDAGKGKTMLLCGIIDELSQMAKNGANIAYFFCQDNTEGLNNSAAVLRGLIWMLVKQQPLLIDEISEDSFEGENAWFGLQKVFVNILNNPNLRKTYLILDGLDECTGNRHRLLQLLAKHSSAHANVKWIASSRNWPEIEQELEQAAETKLQLELNEEVLSKAVRSFIEFKVEDLRSKKREKPEIWNTVKDYMLENAQGTFLWVALVWENLKKVAWWKVQGKLKEFPPGLDSIYDRMMSQIMMSEDADLFKSVLSVCTTVLRPITLEEMMVYVDVPESSVEVLEDIVRRCGTILSLQGNTVYLVHQSAKDFLLKQASGELYPYGEEKVQYNLFSASLLHLRENLRRDIYSLRAPGYPVEQIKIPHEDPLIAVRYACVHWVDHLLLCNRLDTKKDLQEEGLVESFLSQDYLHWLEAMSIIRRLPVGIASLRRLEESIQAQIEGEPESLALRVRDAIRFVQYTKFAIESCPLQVYYSSLIYSPDETMTRLCYHDKELRKDWIVTEPATDSHWSPCIQSLEGHGAPVASVAWSPDGSRVASVSGLTLRVWNLNSSQCSLTYQDDFDFWGPITWLGESQVASVLSEEHSNFIRVWHLDTNELVTVHEDNHRAPTSMTWAPDGSRFAFGRDNSVEIWDPFADEGARILDAHDEPILSMAWSPDQTLIASESSDRSIKIWDTRTLECVSTLGSCTESICSIAWSPDGSLLASGSDDGNVGIWETKTWDVCYEMGPHNGGIQSVAWAPDGLRLAIASCDRTISIWDLQEAKCTCYLDGHGDVVSSIAWSPDGSLLASVSEDETIKIWDTTVEIDSKDQPFYGMVNAVAWNADRSRLASCSGKVVRVWDTVNGRHRGLSGHTATVADLAWSHDGKQLASASFDFTVRVWNPETEQCTVLDGHTDQVECVSWSHDGNLLASGSNDGTIRIWNMKTSQCTCLGPHGDWYSMKVPVKGVAWSPDGSQIASATWFERLVRVYDPATSQCIILEGHEDAVEGLSWSHDGSRLASAALDDVRVWDPKTRQCILVLPVLSSCFLQFDDISSLRTARGTFDLTQLRQVSTAPDNSDYVPKPSGYGLSEDFCWITYDGINILWVPPDSRPNTLNSFHVSSTNVTIGCTSGHTQVYRFSALKPLEDL